MDENALGAVTHPPSVTRADEEETRRGIKDCKSQKVSLWPAWFRPVALTKTGHPCTIVTGDDQDPLYRMLTNATGEEPSWNFNKYLVDKNGKIVKHYGSRVKPSDDELVADIEAAM